MKVAVLSTLMLSLVSLCSANADTRALSLVRQAVGLRQKLSSIKGMTAEHKNQQVVAEGSSKQVGASSAGMIGLLGIGGSSGYSAGSSRFVVFEKVPYTTSFTFSVNFEETWKSRDEMCAKAGRSPETYNENRRRLKAMEGNVESIEEIYQIVSQLRNVLNQLELVRVDLPSNDLVVIPKIEELLAWARSSSVNILKYYNASRVFSQDYTDLYGSPNAGSLLCRFVPEWAAESIKILIFQN